jgi:Protein of unknown function (DUF3106)
VIARLLLRIITACVGGWMLTAAAMAATPTATAAVVDRSPTWASLNPAQKQALSPLQNDWASIDPNRKQKWLAVAARFPTLPADERLRVQQRMTEWTRLSPAERDKARLQFKEARQVPADERQAKWQAYQALPEAERQSLAQRAQPTPKTGAAVTSIAPKTALAGSDGAAKRNLVQAPNADQVKPVAPLLVQARPGATTSNISTRPPRPSHSQPGLPKIAATPGYVDAATLLPKRGAQGAAAANAADDTAQN